MCAPLLKASENTVSDALCFYISYYLFLFSPSDYNCVTLRLGDFSQIYSIRIVVGLGRTVADTVRLVAQEKLVVVVEQLHFGTFLYKNVGEHLQYALYSHLQSGV